MHQVGDEEVGVELLLGGQVGVGRSDAGRPGQERVVLQDDARGELGMNCQFHWLRRM